MGYAYPDKYLRLMEVDNERLEELKLENKRLLAEADKQSKADYRIYLPDSYTADQEYPLFLALHGNGGNIDEFSDYWKADIFLQNNFIFVYLQSSQVWWHGSYGWTEDMIQARKDIANSFKIIKEKLSIDEDCVLMGGFSGGAIATLETVLSDLIPIKGFIGVSPGTNPPSFSRESLLKAAQRDIRGVLMEGEAMIPVPNQEEMTEGFHQVGLDYKYIINEGIGHWFPDDLSEKLEHSLEFILDD